MLSGHVKECAECQAELERIDALLAAMDAIPVPDPGEDYGERVWKRIEPQLETKRERWWEFFAGKRRGGEFSGLHEGARDWFGGRRLVAVGSIAALVLAAFLVGRYTSPKHGAPENVADAGKIRERILVVAVGEHLGRSEMMLVELANAEPPAAGAKQVNISAEQRRAASLLEENRLYRETAVHDGNTGLADVLDDLERVLLDVAHSPQEVTPAQLDGIRQRIEAGGILFKVRVVGKELQQRETAPAQNSSKKAERNKA
jgi:hypothetical protein